MRQLVHTMFISNNRASFQLWWKESLVEHQKVSKYFAIGCSLNEYLYKGPQLAPLVFDILLRFRAQVFALTTYIEKAFYQISVDNDDRDCLRFLWLDNISSDQPTVTRNWLAGITFGVTSSPFCLNSAFRKQVNQYSDDPEFVNKTLKSFFVNIFISGDESVKKAFELFIRSPNRFKEGNFNWRKWKTNSAQLNDLIYNENKEIHTSYNNTPEKVLSMTWNNKRDTLIYDFSDLVKEAKMLAPTKRNVLKILSSFYNPMGLIQPIITGLKILMQNICKKKLQWWI